ncbi:hypothetical protein MANES_05G115600v8 [Manihot esculenta]|uniref:Uncharacterized protein n=1 Tax=Manihot esculenta TaxID=3983 RepID=A0A2C9VWT1_MANES|nr:hypothetical protein MANES_05G115600v8 [Manihot esculenta]
MNIRLQLSQSQQVILLHLKILIKSFHFPWKSRSKESHCGFRNNSTVYSFLEISIKGLSGDQQIPELSVREMRGRGDSMESLSSSSFVQWNSPLPYVFGGLVIILGLVSVALVILACSHYRSSLETRHKEEKPNEIADAIVAVEPKIVVIMAGDEHPTHVAMPSAFTCHVQQP